MKSLLEKSEKFSDLSAKIFQEGGYYALGVIEDILENYEEDYNEPLPEVLKCVIKKLKKR